MTTIAQLREVLQGPPYERYLMEEIKKLNPRLYAMLSYEKARQQYNMIINGRVPEEI